MFNKDMQRLGEVRSVIRETFEYGNARARQIGRENVFDFSLGNPSVDSPACLNETIIRLVETVSPVKLHGYTTAQGANRVRMAIAEDINRRYNAGITEDCLYMTCGAAASLSICIKALAEPGDCFIAVTPFFPEYRVFTEAAGAKFKSVPSEDKTFQLDLAALESALTSDVKGIIINSPNNPSGVVLNSASLDGLCGLLRKKSAEYNHSIFLISDEPYRELVYDGSALPYLTNLYDDTFVCYSFSKSMSVPGERIGYIAVSPHMRDFKAAYAAICGAGRALGYVCAPSLMQYAAAECVGNTSDVSVYRKNRDLLYGALTEMGYECVFPDGAFYLFVKTPEPDANAFCMRAKKYELLLVPSDSFGCPGYVRIAYCVETDLIERALPAFKKLIDEYK